MREITLKLNKEFKEDLVCRNCKLIAGCLRANFEIESDDNDYEGLRFITIKGNFVLFEKDNALIITDIETLNNVLIHKDLVWEYSVRL